MSIESQLTQEQSAQAVAFLDKLKPEDRANLEQVTALFNELIEQYDFIRPLFFDEPTSVFGVYGIGGWVNKEGQRPDVDVLVMTSVRWDTVGYVPIQTPGAKSFRWGTRGDELLRIFAEHFGNNGFDIELPEEIPDEYSEGVDPRVLMRLTPDDDNPASPIDLVYVSGGYSVPPIRSFEDFYGFDRDSAGNPLGKVALLETVVNRTIPQVHL